MIGIYLPLWCLRFNLFVNTDTEYTLTALEWVARNGYAFIAINESPFWKEDMEYVMIVLE